MERFFYFRDVPDEANDVNDGTSVMVPVKNIRGIAPASTTTLDVWFISGKNETHASNARLTVTQGKLKQVTEQIVSAMNSGPRQDVVTVVYDAMVTTHGASSIQGNNQTVQRRRLSGDITGVTFTSL
tara:strand:+ start:1665 stop:2045 length:381 start_codon:yes stop_codon:yes gene_type:complete